MDSVPYLDHYRNSFSNYGRKKQKTPSSGLGYAKEIRKTSFKVY
ncbi:hypothetical protein LEP1GSC185_3603 [Leptospira licerasiae serovar Varillal str. VAR 010]|uniref:Uncharacterized protein n=1 Tax=Leptospira licerasiae str. MMD4847 TaxID=1049971 RepID=A0ABN0HED7_9LEPT|nr:hypothetical protein LEP1GSC185_3603 [Leptospira licerasiae serovar Varillal str. VAR 010]EJZ43811.1 hypothetical protein LEP1GSC178_2292 [Leptospira licerasiae str. MMD4847]